MTLLEQLIHASEMMPIGIMWLDEQGRIVGANQRLHLVLGYQSPEIVNRSILEIDPFINLLSWRRHWNDLLNNKSSEEKTELISKAGIVFPARVNYALVEQEGQCFCCATVQNIKQSERYKSLFRLTSNIAKLGGWDWDTQHNTFFVSDETRELLGIDIPDGQIPVDDIYDLLLTKLANKKEVDRIKAILQSVRDSGESAEVETLFKFDHGKQVRCQIIAKAVQFDGITTRVFGTIQDVSVYSNRSEEMYMAQMTLENINEMVFWISKDGKVFYANDKATISLGYSRSELLNSYVFDFSPNMESAAWNTHWEELKAEKSLEFETVHLKKSGEEIPVDISLNYFEYEGEEYNCAIVRDITKKKARDLRIRLYNFTINQFPDMVFWVKEDGTLQMVNPTACQLLDFSEENVLNSKIWDIIPALDKSAYKSYWQNLENENERTLKCDISKNDERPITIEFNANFVDFENKRLICLFGKDISERVEQNKRLELANITLEYSNDFVFWVFPNGTLAYANKKAVRELGYTTKELKGLQIFDLKPNVTPEKFIAGWEDLRNGTVLKEEVELKRKDGSLIPTESVSSYIRFENEEQCCIIMRDITADRKKESKLLDAFDRIQKLTNQLEREKSYLKEEVDLNFNFNSIISKGKEYKPVLQKVTRVASTDATVLILGETGTGKELLARAIHNLSERSERAMVKVNCAALPENLIESELFGHEKGAFTGAYQQRVGRFEMADEGTIFLDEIGELPLELQSKLLRVLQEGEFERLGGTSTIKVDVRVIAATNRNLEDLVAKGGFREDLYYRLNVFPIQNLALRERKEDIPLLTQFFLDRFALKMGRKDLKISNSSMDKLQVYEFPGNIRELENMIERAVILSTGDELNLSAIMPDLKKRSISNKRKLFPTLEEMQREHILEALNRANWKITGTDSASTLLGMNGKTLASRMRKFGIRKGELQKV